MSNLKSNKFGRLIELPVNNKDQVYRRAIKYSLFIIIIMVWVFIKNQHLSVIYFTIVLILLWFGITIYRAKKNNIRRVLLVNEKLFIYHSSGLIQIPVKEIEHISVSINNLDFKKGLLNLYVLHLSNNHIFGKKIILKYKFSKNEPEAIKSMKKRIGRI